MKKDKVIASVILGVLYIVVVIGLLMNHYQEQRIINIGEKVFVYVADKIDQGYDDAKYDFVFTYDHNGEQYSVTKRYYGIDLNKGDTAEAYIDPNAPTELVFKKSATGIALPWVVVTLGTVVIICFYITKPKVYK